MESIANRLAAIRKDSGLTLRKLAAVVTAHGFAVSHYSVHQYERDATSPSAGYLQAICRIFAISPSWLLLGEGARTGSRSRSKNRAVRNPGSDTSGGQSKTLRADWQRFIESCPQEHPMHAKVADTIIASREPEPADEAAAPDARRCVSVQELKRRMGSSGRFLGVGLRHLAWIQLLLAKLPHVVYLTCKDAIVIGGKASAGSGEWSAVTLGEVRGPKAAGRSEPFVALRNGKSVVMLASRDAGATATTNFAVPVRGPDGNFDGALGLMVPRDLAQPFHLGLLAYAGAMAEQELTLQAAGSQV